MSGWLDRLAAEVARRRPAVEDRPFLIALAGGVASGKSFLADQLAGRLRGEDEEPAVEVVATDGFLFPNAVLAERGLMDRKGFPETYDWDALSGFLEEVAAGRRRLTVPTYSHRTYDRSWTRVLDRPDVLILEGLIALDRRIGPVDLGLYIEAADADLIGWYVERFMALERWKAPRLAERLAAVGGDPEALARDIWNRINAPNLRDHIVPTRDRADLILVKARDHAVSLEARGRA